MKIPFWKLESIGNDFPLIHLHELESQPDLGKLAQTITDRRFGVGGDGLLTLRPLEKDLLELRMFNPDGTEDFCGNGLRCAARHAVDQRWVGDRFTLSHLGRTVAVEVDGERIVTHIGVASFDPSQVPLASGQGELFQNSVFNSESESIIGSALTTGSTHVIIPVTELPTEDTVQTLGPKIESFWLYPARTSVIWSEVLSENHLKIRIWERGVGETLGCGTGSSAAAVNHFRLRGSGGRVRVDNPGGSVWVSARKWDQPVAVEGSARESFRGLFQVGS